jgi:hypothetical protein
MFSRSVLTQSNSPQSAHLYSIEVLSNSLLQVVHMNGSGDRITKLPLNFYIVKMNNNT